MHACAALLEEVLSLVRFEEQALVEEDIDKAEELAGRRAALLLEAWERREGYDQNALRSQLLEVESGHKRLQETLESLRAKLQAQRNAGRKQSRYFNGDRYLQSELRKSLYCDKRS